MKNRMLLTILISLVTAALVSSCATTGTTPRPVSKAFPEPVQRMALYHTVAPGETIWRISKMYDVDVETIRRANRMTSSTPIEIGQKIYVPNAAPRKDVISLYKSTKWKYIIVHHSATDNGNSAFFNAAHKNKGWDSVGYHFVIDNGTCGKESGQIEPTPRWLKQLNGAHCKAADMNEKAIGICLVGNFSTDEVDSKQMRSLVYLVQLLSKYYNVPSSNIMGHGQVPGAKTECPGKKFPWQTFVQRVRRPQ